MTDRSLSDLDPAFLPLVQQFLSACAQAGLNVRVIVTWRSGTEQNEAKAEGLSNASSGQSPHNCVDEHGNPAARAIDFGVFEPDGAYATDGTDPRYAQAAQIGKDLGMSWGGDWHHPDFDHLEMANWNTA